MSFYPQEFIQRLRNEVPVSTVISRRIPLKRKGREFVACCPFHKEKTPSFTVNDNKGFYHCFGCGAHGDSINFLMEFDKLSYVEAIESLAKEIGVSLPVQSPQLRQREQERRKLYDVMEYACEWFCKQLMGSGGGNARKYLQKRNIGPDTVKYFRLGYAPDNKYALKQYLIEQKGFSEAQLIAVGLVIKTDNDCYDRFRGRVIFPIADKAGKIIAFGGRILHTSNHKIAKYLNSPETDLFSKGKILYNWKLARSNLTAESPLLIVEGYMDVIALHQAGFPQAVAPLGTALTKEHLQQIWQYCDNPILCLDGDRAGQQAAWRCAQSALAILYPGKNLYFCTLPSGQDPDDILRESGAASFRELLNYAQPLSQMIFAHLSAEIGSKTPEQKAALEKKLQLLTNKIADNSLRQHFKSYFRKSLWDNLQQQHSKKQPNTFKSIPISPERSKGLILLQQQLLRGLICRPELLEDAEIEAALMGFEPINSELGEVQRWLLSRDSAASMEINNWPEIVRKLQQNNNIPLASIFLSDDFTPAALKAAWRKMLNAYLIVQIQEDIDNLQQELATDLDDNKLVRMTELQKQIEALKSELYSDDAL